MDVEIGHENRFLTEPLVDKSGLVEYRALGMPISTLRNSS